MTSPRSVEEWASDLLQVLGESDRVPELRQQVARFLLAYAAEQVAQARAEGREEERKVRAKLVEAGWGRRVHEDGYGL